VKIRAGFLRLGRWISIALSFLRWLNFSDAAEKDAEWGSVFREEASCALSQIEGEQSGLW
jgi:hypothetical protein